MYHSDLCLHKNIERYIASAAKFEFYLIFKDYRFAKTDSYGNVKGVCWDALASELESTKSFCEFDISRGGFAYFEDSEPKKLMLNCSHCEKPELVWSDQADGTTVLDGWLTLLTSRLHRLRCNVAHGSKAFPPKVTIRDPRNCWWLDGL
ncbi:hypothetical protein L0Z66_00660 [Phaeobacter sp. BS34]